MHGSDPTHANDATITPKRFERPRKATPFNDMTGIRGLVHVASVTCER
jgi:hypothetical protein